MTTSLQDLFAKYSSWYVKKYVPTLIEDDPDDGMKELIANRWDHPFRGLRPLGESRVAKVERDFGPVPLAYTELLTTMGVGTILAASDGEPAPFRILRPTELKKARKLAFGCLSTEDTAMVAKKLDLDTSKMMPILSDGEDDEDAAFWVMLTRQTKQDDRVVLLERDHEDGWPLGRRKKAAKSLHEFVARWIACAKKLEPLNPYDGI